MVDKDCEKLKKKTVVGQVEKVSFLIKGKRERFDARIDSGAASSSIDAKIVADLKLGPVLSVKKVRNAHGETLRPVVEADIFLKRKKIKAIFTVADRSRMKYKVLVGRNILKEGFLIDVSK